MLAVTLPRQSFIADVYRSFGTQDVSQMPEFLAWVEAYYPDCVGTISRFHYFDDELEEERYVDFDSKDEAEAELDSYEDGRVSTIRSLKATCENEQELLWKFVKSKKPNCIGLWYSDSLDVAQLSAPHGIIFDTSGVRFSPVGADAVTESAAHLVARLLESDDLDDLVLDLDTYNPYFNDFDFAEVCGIIAEVLGGQPGSFNFEREVSTSPSTFSEKTKVDVVITFRLAEKRKSISVSSDQWREMRGRIKDYIGDTKDCPSVVLMHGHDSQKPAALRKILILYTVP